MKTATVKDNKIVLKFYSSDSSEFYRTLEKVKAIDGRRFNANTKFWTIPLNELSIQQITDIGFTLDDSISQAMETNQQQAAEQRAKIIELQQSITIDEKKLYPYQAPHTKLIIQSLIMNNAALDASDTGTGKTYVACAAAQYLGLDIIVLTPKSVIPSWYKAAKYFAIKCFAINYEQYRSGKLSEYLTLRKTDDGKDHYRWQTTEKQLLIFDEAHRCKNEKTLNSKMLRAAKRSKSPTLALSATIADNPLHLYSLGLVLGLFDDYPSFWNWAYKHGVYKSFFGVEFNPKPEFLQKIHQQLFPAKGSRIRIADLGDAFPDNLIITDSYDMNSNAKKIQSAYRKMDGELQRLYATKEKDKGSSILTEILRARQEIELLKVPTIIEMAEDLIEEGNSIAIFVNFKETISVLSQKLKCDCIIDGSITGEQREKNIEAFQSDQSRIILCNIKAGGVGISLHDLNGTYPRVSLISPTNSAVDLVQALGRIHRAGAKSKAIQRLLFCAGTIEEEIAQNVSAKIQNIALINDGDLTSSIVINIKQQGD